ncbi:MAG: tripartite tricarboxylate transporter substrate binding protein [Proteobacteria bacterium]|nr:tripartite tricarboxylate transporter substrate binding protein [Pseudomonadota bacterium]
MPTFVPSRRQFVQAAALGSGATLLGLPLTSQAQDGPPLRLVVTFPPGGSTDITARTIQPRLGELARRSVIVDNKPGAASQIGTQFVARAAPDGNTLLVCFDTHAINPIVKPNLPYDTFKDFVGVSLAVRFPLVIGASASVPAANLREFVAAARKQPARFSYASTGVGSMNHLVMEDIKRQAGIFVLHVPHGGGGPAVQAVISDQASLTLLSYAALKGQISAGKVKPLAVTGATRLPDLPNVPTVAESGFPGFEAYSWIGIFAPSATPGATVAKLTGEFQGALNTPDVKQRLNALGFEVVASDGPALDRYTKQQYDRWTQFVKTTGLKVVE